MDAPSRATETLRVRCCVAGGGPAGMMLGFLLARAGVEVAVLEKHADFLRDFRGDTIHASTLEVMYELGLLEEFMQRPHQEFASLDGYIDDVRVTIADFSHLPTRCKFIAVTPQWDFLDFLAEHGRRYPGFHLRMQAEVTGLVREGGRVAGVRATTPDGPLEVRADLVVGADGRGSTVRAQAGLQVEDLGAPMDVLWMRISRAATDPGQTLGHVESGRILILIDRGDCWQCAYVIPKGSWNQVREQGLPAFRAEVARLEPFLADRMGELTDWTDVKLLTVRVDRLLRWHLPNLLCIGDAAHAMSPIGGVGINLAVQDAVAAARLLAGPLRRGSVTEAELEAVQRRREWPTRMTQRLQVLVQERTIRGVLNAGAAGPTELPLPIRLLRRWPRLARIPARIVGVGFRPEHVKGSVLERPLVAAVRRAGGASPVA
ncbi:MAG TPA: FAD-dependent oxidoreductase [Longimicrobiaceae bacterium]|nr:FAD-dependent oxidoreductase [Longimicrobiaceae bacterium]